jgi:hypothetical protein
MVRLWASILSVFDDIAHHDLGFDGVCQTREKTGLFGFIGDPIPVTDGCQRDGFCQKIEDFKLGAAFVSAQAYTMHSCFPPFLR